MVSSSSRKKNALSRVALVEDENASKTAWVVSITDRIANQQ